MRQMNSDTFFKFSIKNNIFIFYALVFYFTAPHLFFYNSFGIRDIKPFDLAVIFLFFIIFYEPLKKIPKPFLLITVWYLIRSFVAFFDFGFASLFFSFKLIEYLIIIYSISFLNEINKLRLLSIFLIVSLIFIIFEIFNIRQSYEWHGRFLANFGGPYELGAISILFIYLFENSYKKTLSFFVMTFSATKTAFISLIPLFIKYFYELFLSRKKKEGIVFLVILVMSFVSAIIFFVDNRFYDFLVKTYSFISSIKIIEIYNMIPYTFDHDAYHAVYRGREFFIQNNQFMGKLDFSTALRLHTYMTSFKSVNSFNIFFGNGPGFYGVSLDSSILRIYCEAGLIGLFLFFLVLNDLHSRFKNFAFICAIFIIFCFSDVFFSARFLPLLFLLSYIRKLNFK
jgi:hypothetical protein